MTPQGETNNTIELIPNNQPEADLDNKGEKLRTALNGFDLSEAAILQESTESLAEASRRALSYTTEILNLPDIELSKYVMEFDNSGVEIFNEKKKAWAINALIPEEWVAGHSTGHNFSMKVEKEKLVIKLITTDDNSAPIYLQIETPKKEGSPTIISSTPADDAMTYSAYKS